MKKKASSMSHMKKIPMNINWEFSVYLFHYRKSTIFTDIEYDSQNNHIGSRWLKFKFIVGK